MAAKKPSRRKDKFWHAENFAPRAACRMAGLICGAGFMPAMLFSQETAGIKPASQKFPLPSAYPFA
jgi:hypothetical protein